MAKMLVTAAAAILAFALAGCSKSPDEVESSASKHLEARELRSAMIELKDLLQREPDRPRARLMLGRTLSALGDYAGAEAELRRAVALGVPVDEVAALLARAMSYQARLEPLLADELLSKTNSPTARAEVLMVRANALQLLGRTDESEALLEESVRLAPRSGAPKAAKALLWLRNRRVDEAGSLLQEAAQTDPRSAEVARALGAYHSARGRYRDASAAYSRAVELASSPEGDRELVYTSLAALVAIEIEAKELEAAKSTLARLDQLGPRRLNALLHARIDLLEGRLPQARQRLESLLSRGQEDPEASLLLSLVHLQQGNQGQAESSIKDVMRVAPDNPVARQVLAQIRMSEGKPVEAVELLRPTLRDDLGRGITLAVQASMAAGDRQGALAMLDEVANSDKLAATAAQELARSYLALDEPGRAISALERASNGTEGVASREGLKLAARIAAKDEAGAFRDAEELARRHPKDPAIATMLGDFYLRVGKLDRARSAYVTATNLDPADASIGTRLAMLDASTGDFVAAESRLGALLEKHPRDVAPLIAMAELKTRRGDQDGAAASLMKAIEIAPKNPRPHMLLARLRVGQGDAEGATVHSKESLALDPNNTALLRMHASTLLAAKRGSEAIALVRAALKKQPTDESLSMLLVALEASAGTLDSALAVARDAVQQDPRSLIALGVLGDLQLRKGDLGAAEQTIAKLRADPAGRAPALLLEAGLALRQQRPAAAADAIAQANRIVPSGALAIREYTIRRQARLKSPDGPLKTWLQGHPDDVPVLLALGDHHLSLKEESVALGHYERVIALQPGNVVALNNAAWIRGVRGQIDQGLALGERAYRMNPSSPLVADTYGWLLSESGDHASAITVLEKARKLSKPIPDLEYHYAQVLSRAGRNSEARKILVDVLASGASFPAKPDAERLLAAIPAKDP